jgi:hypothetical protein
MDMRDRGFNIPDMTNIRWNRSLFVCVLFISRGLQPAASVVSPSLFLLSSPRRLLLTSFNPPAAQENQPNPPSPNSARAPPSSPAAQQPSKLAGSRVVLPRTVVEILNPGSSRSLLSFLPYLGLARCFPLVFRHPGFRRETNLPRDPHERFTWPTTRTELSQDRPRG